MMSSGDMPGTLEFSNPVSRDQLEPSAQDEWDDEDDGLEKPLKITSEDSMESPRNLVSMLSSDNPVCPILQWVVKLFG